MSVENWHVFPIFHPRSAVVLHALEAGAMPLGLLAIEEGSCQSLESLAFCLDATDWTSQSLQPLFEKVLVLANSRELVLL